MDARWRIQLFGELQAIHPERTVSRFRTKKTASLFAYLAYYPEKSHTRDVLIELFWPAQRPQAGRTSLRQALATLRRHLTLPGATTGHILETDHVRVRLNPAAYTTDVQEFHEALSRASETTSPPARIPCLKQAAALYRGELLTGLYDDWIIIEQHRLAGLFEKAAHQLIQDLEAEGDLPQAVHYARLLAQQYPLDQEYCYSLMRLLRLAGNHSDALEVFNSLERRLQAEHEEKTGDKLQALQQEILQMIPAGRNLVTASKPVPSSEIGAFTASPPPSLSHFTLHSSHLVTTPAPAAEREEAPESGYLPLQLTRFFGREAEIEHVCSRFQEGARLLTLTGTGGSGKTRLAVEIAIRSLKTMFQAAWFVSLVDIGEPRRILGAFHSALHLPYLPGSDLLRDIIQVLSAQRSLLVLDNFEQLVDASNKEEPGGPDLVRLLLEKVPSLTVLVTSRKRLRINGEQEFAVLPLAVPHGERDPALLAECPSIKLFVDRAQLVRSDFILTEGNAPSIADLCDALEGIPLAIELAAARLQVLSPSQLLQQIDRRLDLLVTRQRDVPARHRTLRALVEWSYNLLPPMQQQLFTRLSIFRGGWTLEGAVHVCTEAPRHEGPGEISTIDLALEQLEDLVEASLVTTGAVDGEMRFRMWETVREYAAEQLSAEDRAEVKRRHTDYYARFARAGLEEFTGRQQGVWLRRLEMEGENIRAAMQFALAQQEPAAFAPLALALGEALRRMGWCEEARRCLETALEALEEREQWPALEGDLLCGLARIAHDVGNLADLRQHTSISLRHRESLEDRPGTAECLNLLAILAIEERKFDEAQNHLQQALTLYPWSHHYGAGAALHNLGKIASLRGDLKAASHHYEQALARRREAGDVFGQAETLGNIGAVAFKAEDYLTARRLYQESLALHQQISMPYGIGVQLNNLAEVAEIQGDIPTAVSLYFHSHKILEKIQSADAHYPAEALHRLQERLPPEEFAQITEAAAKTPWQDIINTV